MKFDQVKNFENHIHHSSAFSLSQLYAVVMKDDEERKCQIERLEALLSKYIPPFERVRVDIQDPSQVGLLEEEIGMFSLFQEIKLIIVKVTEKQLVSVQKTIQHLPRGVFIILSLETLPEKVYLPLKNHLVVLDLREEKPWQHKERLLNALLAQFKLAGKEIPLTLIQEMIETIGLEEGVLGQFCENLICYIGTERVITHLHYKACLKTKSKLSSWQLTDALLLGEVIDAGKVFAESQDPLTLITQLRFRLQQMMKLKTQPEAVMLYAQQKNRYTAFIKTVRPEYFVAALNFLFDLEYTVKNKVADPLSIIDLLKFKIGHYQARYAN